MKICPPIRLHFRRRSCYGNLPAAGGGASHRLDRRADRGPGASRIDTPGSGLPTGSGRSTRIAGSLSTLGRREAHGDTDRTKSLTAAILICSIVFASLANSGSGDDLANGNNTGHRDSLVESRARICVLGDPGTGTAEQYAVARAAERAGCTQVRLVGDLIYPSGISGSGDPLLQRNFYAPYSQLLRAAPFYLVEGNHDHEAPGGTAWLDVARRDARLHYPNHYYSESWPEVCFFSLDTTIYEKLRFLFERAPQTDWLRHSLEQAHDSGRCKFSVVFAHHPYRSSGPHGDAEPLLKLFLFREIIGKVDLYIAGHDHILSDEGTSDGTRLLVSGTAGKKSRKTRPLPGNRFAVNEYGFIVLEFERDDSGDILAKYKICTVDIGRHPPAPTDRWEGTVNGQGIRL